MGCTSSQPTGVEPLHTAASKGGEPNVAPTNRRQSFGRQDSGRSNASSKLRGRGRGSAAVGGGGGSVSGSLHGNGYTVTTSTQMTTMNGGGEDHATDVSPTSDPRWIQLWQTHQELLLDPADVHATMEACMSKVTNRLSATEVTFLQRKVRSIVRACSKSNESNPANRRVSNILRSSSTISQEQETKLVAEKYHLLSNHVVRKVLPRLPTIESSATTTGSQTFENGASAAIATTASSAIADNVFLLGLFLHESLWDRVAEIAATSAKDAGAEMDVNKYKLPQETPSPFLPSKNGSAAATDILPQPAGISLHALTFLMGLALRGSRMQKLQLLFYLLLPPRILQDFLEEHPAGGPPLWLLEVGSEIVLSMASLSHYYYHGETFTPANIKSTSRTTSSSSSRLVLHGPTLISLIKSILLPPAPQVPEGAKTPNGGGLFEAPSNGSNGKSPIASPAKKSTKMRRRASNQSSEEEMTVASPQTEVMERLGDPSSPFHLDDYVVDDLGLRDTLLQAAAELESKETVNMQEFYDFCQQTLKDDALDALMHRLFGHSILPSPSLEMELVASRWREWQETECVLYNKAAEEPEGTFEMLTQSVRKILLMQKDDTIEASSERATTWKPFGGFGGFDGRGAMGYGVMYCIDKKWWNAWESYVGWSWAGENSVIGITDNKPERKRRRPGGVSSEPLLDRLDDDIVAGTYGSYELMKDGLHKDIDYVLVPASVWDILYELYGGGPPLPRMVLPPATSNKLMGISNPIDSCGPVDFRSPPSEDQLDAMASTDKSDRVLRIPQQMEVNTHPWVFHVHLCDPQQPYRRGDAGPLSIRVMGSPDQPLWRLYAEVVVRLPFHLYRAYGSDGRGRARIWKRTDPSGPKDAMARFGPWMLLCKNRFATLPKRGDDDELEQRFEELKEDWKAFADNASVESSGLVDGDQLMIECAIVSRNGEFMWPREAAAKAGRVKRLADKDMKFRQILRGVDDNGSLLAMPPNLVGMKVDAMDTSGKWFQVEITMVQVVTADTDEDEDSMEMENDDPRKDSGESKQVLVDFSEHGGHTEWIDVESDRLASPGRFTIDSVDDTPEAPQKPATAAAGAGAADKSKPQAQIKKVPDPSEANGKLCTIPGYGACGLANLGNTCYANSAIQCVSYLPMLRAYLLSLQYKATGDLNKDNPLGTEGKLLEEFADLLRQMWSGKMGEKSPTKFRAALGKANELFQGADQQDSQEFLSFILDVLHEDSNRVRRKPPVEGLEDDWKKKTSLHRVGEEEWRRFLRRNRSIMADVGMGQVLNTVTCPVCNFSSRNFDPFNLLSVPFPTVADVIFKCYVVRRASAYNAPWILNRPGKGTKARVRFVRRDLVPNPKPPSPQFVVEEYIIAMSRLADSGDLKLQIQNLAGIPASALSVCRGEVISMKDKKDDSVVRTHFQATLLTDKEGPCSQLATRQRANSEDLGAPPAAPSIIVAFESTIRSRPQDDKKDEDSSDSNAEEEEEEQTEKPWEPTKKELKELEKQVALYGNFEECRLYDTDTLLVAKALSRSLWPRTEDELKLGLRVDAIDHKEHWFPGSVVEIIENGPSANGGESKENEAHRIKVRVHFDNFSSKWDEMYTIEQFREGRVRPLYSHAAPRVKPTEFIVHHRFTDRNTRVSNLFGQSFYVQCHNEWTTARAGAQILAQASRFLKIPPEYAGGAATDEAGQERETKIQRLYDRTQAVISDLIDLLVDCDRDYVHYALGVAEDPYAPAGKKAERFRNPGFDASTLSQNLIKKVGALLHRLPFEVRVCTIDSTLGGTNEELAYPFSLMRTIGNYMNARHAIVLQWREPPSDKKAPNGRHSNYLGAPVMYVQPKVAVDAGSASILNKANQTEKRSSTSRGSGGLPLGVCLTEYCKLQQLPTWRCPKCKDFRDGKQNMALWRLPDLLTIHMKRFNCSARWREKITTKVNFPLTGLDLKEWCHNESPVIQEDTTGESYIYDLVGVLNHYGGMTGGHYVATCKATACSRDGSEEVAYDFNGAGSFKPFFADSEGDPDTQSGWKFGRQKSEASQKKMTATSTARAAAESAEPLWLQFDDDLVEPIPPRFVVSETAYVLFYRRRRITPANIAKYSTLE